MINFQKLFQVGKSQVAKSKLEKLHQSEAWEKLNDTEAQIIQGGNSPVSIGENAWEHSGQPEWPGPGSPPPGWSGFVSW